MNRLSRGLAFILLLVFTDIFINSCRKCGDGIECSYVRYHEPKVSAGYRKLSSTSSLQIKEDTLHLLVDFVPEYYTFRNGGRFDLFSSSAYACSPCMPGELGSKDTVKRFEILSDQDFDAAHKKGTSLNDLFLISRWDYALDSMVYNSLDSFLVNGVIEKGPPYALPIHLIQKPAAEKTHRLRFEMDYTDDRKYVTDAGVFIFP